MSAATWTVYTVARQPGSKRYAVFDGAELIEGGFFSKRSALIVAADYTEISRKAATARDPHARPRVDPVRDAE